MVAPTLYPAVTVILLAGGKSSRMGSEKGFLVYEKSTFVDRLVEMTKRMTPHVLLSVNAENAQEYAYLDIPLVIDVVPDSGPLGGVVSTLREVHTPWFFLISIDAPKVSIAILNNLWERRTGFDAVVYADQNRMHPLVGLYKTHTKTKWEEALRLNKLRLSSILATMHVRQIKADPIIKEAIQNVNTPQDFATLQKTKL